MKSDLPEREAKIVARTTQWLFESALPHWRRYGFDGRGFAFEELDFSGKPKETGYRRTLVQFRQCYVFARMAMLGKAVPDVATDLFFLLVSHAWHPDGGWVHKLTPEGAIADGTRDTYDHAFFLLAAAWVYRLSGRTEALDWVHRTLNFMDSHMADPIGGYIEAIPSRVPRRQNPHMHLFEALLALYEFTREPEYLGRAENIFGLLRNRFIDNSGYLREYFSGNWSIPSGGAHDLIEPGHHFEWSWLLHEYARLTNTPVEPVATQLFNLAAAHGCDKDGLVVEAIDTAGSVRNSSKKLWAQTECIKARLARTDARHISADAIDLVEAVLSKFISPQTPAVWYESLDTKNVSNSKRMPASTYYHIVSAFLELLRKTRIEPTLSLPLSGGAKAAFLDRDGVLNHDTGYVHKIDDFKWVAGAQNAVHRLNDAGYLVIVVTNQSGIARGFFDESDFQTLHRHIDRSLNLNGARIDAVYYCPHHTQGAVVAYRRDCDCRKPQPGLLRRAIAEYDVDIAQSFFVGDKQTDCEAAQAIDLTYYQFDGCNLDEFIANILVNMEPNRMA